MRTCAGSLTMGTTPAIKQSGPSVTLSTAPRRARRYGAVTAAGAHVLEEPRGADEILRLIQHLGRDAGPYGIVSSAGLQKLTSALAAPVRPPALLACARLLGSVLNIPVHTVVDILERARHHGTYDRPHVLHGKLMAAHLAHLITRNSTTHSFCVEVAGALQLPPEELKALISRWRISPSTTYPVSALTRELYRVMFGQHRLVWRAASVTATATTGDLSARSVC